MSLVIDLRCLQDKQFYDRGIGFYTKALLAQAPKGWVGLYDPALPPVPAPEAALAGALTPHAYVPDAKFFLNPAPFFPNQGFCARLLSSPHVRRAACVHDFIPFDDQPTYLHETATRLDYFTSLAWLKQYDLYFPVSAPTNNRLKALFGDVESHVTGVGLPDFLTHLPAATPSHILMVGGDDPRKNPEVLLRAHQASPLLRQYKLVITGDYSPQTCARLQAISQVELPGRVSDARMAALYAGALVVVTPSRAEGFSMPVVEACAANVPSIASNIPAHQALLPAAFLFAPDDVQGLTRLLEDTLKNREKTCLAQRGLAAPFSKTNVAEKVFSTLLQTPKHPTHQKKLAVFSPMPPTRSGIADHSAQLVAALRQFVAVDVFTTSSALNFQNGAYDAVLCVIGNAPLHQDAYELCCRYGAACLCHDSRLLGLATAKGLEYAAERASQELERLVTKAEITRWAQDETKREASFLGPLARAARPLIFHAPQAVTLCRERFGVTAQALPFPMQRGSTSISAAQKQAARARLGIQPAEKLIVSFGFLVPGKAIAESLSAMALLKEVIPTAKLVFAGQADQDLTPFQAQATALGVTLGTGFLSEADYQDWLMAADAGLQLRTGQPGGISGALQDCIGVGLPCVASADLAENVTAPSYVIRVADQPDPAEISQALEKALSWTEDIQDAQKEYCTAHSMPVYAASLLRLLGMA